MPNSNFEFHNDCSNMDINNAIGWSASSLTPDYYNSCVNSGSYNNVPYTWLGYQQDCCGGNGYAGEYVFYVAGGAYDQREYIYTKLTDTLQAGHTYIASMYINSSNYWHNAIVTMGILFTDTATILPTGNTYIIKTIPQVKSNVLLADTANWMLVQDTFIAVGNEVYLTIGNFNSDSTCGMNNTISSQEVYYYIDNVSVYDMATMGIEQLKTKNEQLEIYPNPANKILSIVSSSKTEKITMFDLLGNEILQTQQKEIDVSAFQNGVYFLQIGNSTQKFIVQH